LDLSYRRVLISRHIVFDESAFPFFTTSTSTPPADPAKASFFFLLTWWFRHRSQSTLQKLLQHAHMVVPPRPCRLRARTLLLYLAR
jgi:hypothetical protein